METEPDYSYESLHPKRPEHPFIKLLKKEFLFDRYDEFTGKKLFVRSTKKNHEKEFLKHEYRGITLYFKEVIESVLAFVLIIAFIILLCIFCYRFLFTGKLSLETNDLDRTAQDILNFSKYILNIAGGLLILDSVLLISALISSPGIDETIDSISVTIAGVLLLFMGMNEDKFIEYPMLVLKDIVPLSLVVVVLIFTKHILRGMNGSDKYRIIEGIEEDEKKSSHSAESKPNVKI
jgi:hypothetical protein